MKRREYIEDKDTYDIYLSTTDYETYCKIKECMEQVLKEDSKSEMDKLENYLSGNDYEFTRRPLFDGEQIVVFKHNDAIWDAVCHKWSTGHEHGLLEVMWNTGEVEGCLSADDIIKKIS